MDKETEILARISRLSAELARDALSINRPFLATLLDMTTAEAQLDAARQTRPESSLGSDDNMSPKNPSDAPNTGT